MDNKRVAQQLLKIAKELTGASRKAADFPYASIIIGSKTVSFRISTEKSTSDAQGTNPYGNNPMKEIENIFKLVRRYGVKDDNVEIIPGR